MGLCKHRVISAPPSNFYDSDIKSYWGNRTGPLSRSYQPEKDSVSVFPDHFRRPVLPEMYWGPHNRQRLSSHSPWCLFRGGQVYAPLLYCALTNSFIYCQMSACCGACPCAITAAHRSSCSPPARPHLLFFFTSCTYRSTNREPVGGVQTQLAPLTLVTAAAAAALDQSCGCSASAGCRAVSAPRQYDGSGAGGDPGTL